MIKKEYPVIIFDMDGVLFDSEPLHVKFEEIFLLEMGVSLSNAEKRDLIGLAGDNMWRYLKKTYGLKPSAEELVENDKLRRMKFFIENETTIMPGAADLLYRLHKDGIRMSLASSSLPALINLQLSRAGFGSYFEHKVSGYIVEKGKPAPDIFQHTAQLMNTDPSRCVVIEDSENGVKGSVAAGMKCIGYSGYHHIYQDLGEAHLVVNDLNDITLKTIEDLLAS